MKETAIVNEVSMLIGGKNYPASNGATFERINPVTGEVASRAPRPRRSPMRTPRLRPPRPRFPRGPHCGPPSAARVC
ncbi:hypothetical protein ABIE53_005544 [Burkholderia sp. OAS925]